jgi:hypothetical protein
MERRLVIALHRRSTAVEVKIGVQDSPREISLDSDETAEAVTAAVKAAIDAGGLLSLNDDRGRTILINAAKISYVEIGAPSTRRVGFGG